VRGPRERASTDPDHAGIGRASRQRARHWRRRDAGSFRPVRQASDQPGAVKRDDGRSWYQGPVFEYRASSKPIVVNVAGSSWPLSGINLAKYVVSILKDFRELPGTTIVDFGAGSWLRYARRIQRLMGDRNLYVVEYSEAYHGKAAEVRRKLEPHATFWSPAEFAKDKKQRFDLAILVNVLNTIPEETHRRSVFQALAARLNPRGRLVVYQRMWVESENPKGALAYGDGWMVPQSN